MPEPTSIVAMIAAIKHSFDIIKAVKDADYDLDKSILKEKIAGLIDSLLETKIQANETLDVIQEKDKKIADLENKLSFKSELVRHISAYYEINADEKPFGDPYCSNCWETSHKAVHLHQRHNNYEVNLCPFCKTEYNAHYTPLNLKGD